MCAFRLLLSGGGGGKGWEQGRCRQRRAWCRGMYMHASRRMARHAALTSQHRHQPWLPWLIIVKGEAVGLADGYIVAMHFEDSGEQGRAGAQLHGLQSRTGRSSGAKGDCCQYNPLIYYYLKQVVARSLGPFGLCRDSVTADL